MEFEQALGIARLMIDSGIPLEEAIFNSVIPIHHQQRLRDTLIGEENIVFEPPRMLISGVQNDEWLRLMDRSLWHYWPTLRTYLLGNKLWTPASVRSLDEITDRILGQLANPQSQQFDIRGLVVGYVQSGKTANYTSLIAKAADVGYRLVIVLSGMDKGLRRQTQIRLNKELVGYPDNRIGSVHLPSMGRRWHQFTTEDLGGDFQVGNANYAALQGTQPVLLVIKKNGAVLRRLHTWLDLAPDDVRNTLPVLVIDDEADQASIDTRGSYQIEIETADDEYEEPSVINRLIRGLLSKFERVAYVAYTATPFANILIPHDTFDRSVENDLYPKDFIIDLPKPYGYFGAEELFGRFDSVMGQDIGGLDVIRPVQEQELDDLESQHIFPPTLENAILDFVLAGAARHQREQNDFPATMLLHGSHLVLRQMELYNLVQQRFSELRDEWRYQRRQGIRQRLLDRWNNEFRPVTRANHLNLDVDFSQIEPNIGTFFESLQVRVINSSTGEVLDYEQEPFLKTIAIGGNRLSRGLTLEGLLMSYFFRSTKMYDTLMQMGRWFGFRSGYEDLTRIYMTRDLSGWFSDLAMVEYELRQDIQMYEARNLTPLELGTRILKHPSMLVTSRLKQRFSRSIVIEQCFSGTVSQTFRFPFQNIDELMSLLNENLVTTRTLLQGLGRPTWDNQGAVWQGITPELIVGFLQTYRINPNISVNISIPLIVDYIHRQNEVGELTNWTVAVRGRGNLDPILGEFDFGFERNIPMISRNRLSSSPDSLGIITNPGDELVGLTDEQVEQTKLLRSSEHQSLNPLARLVRPPTDGLLLIYPISRFSGHEHEPRQTRLRLFDEPHDPRCNDVICFAISFPHSENDFGVRGEYVLGTVDWSPL